QPPHHLPDGFHHGRMSVAHDQGCVVEKEVHVAVAVEIDEIDALCPLDSHRIGGVEGRQTGVASGEHILRTPETLRRAPAPQLDLAPLALQDVKSRSRDGRHGNCSSTRVSSVHVLANSGALARICSSGTAAHSCRSSISTMTNGPRGGRSRYCGYLAHRSSSARSSRSTTPARPRSRTHQ